MILNLAGKYIFAPISSIKLDKNIKQCVCSKMNVTDVLPKTSNGITEIHDSNDRLTSFPH